ncbi:MAG: serine hydrolase [Anaerolineae bacterium]
MSLEHTLRSILDEARMEAGIAVTHIETGEQVEVNGRELYPMASTFKIPILVTVGQQIAAGRFSLDERIELKDTDKSAGSGILPFFQAGLQPTRRDLLTLMIIISDNTATDMTVDLVGGAQVVESTMHALGLTDIFFKMNCKDLLKSLFPAELMGRPLEEIHAWSNENDILRDGVAFSRSSDNNVSSAHSMTKLNVMLFTGEIVTGEVRDELIRILHTQQFNQRLPRFLPPGVPFAHKTGTIGGFCNDSGVMTISDTNHVAVTAFGVWEEERYWKQPEARNQRLFEVESALGRIGKAVYEHYQTGESAAEA